MTSCTKWRGALARTGLLTSVWLAAIGCGDGDELTADGGARNDSGLPYETDGGAHDDMDGSADAQIDIDSHVGQMDATADGTTADGSSQEPTDGAITDATVLDPDGSIRPDGGTCPTGYQLVSGFCYDIDECKSGTGPVCNSAPFAFCVNTPGSAECGCHLGQKKNLAGTLCEDINECDDGTALCDPGVACTNIDGPGRYMCAGCLPGQAGGAGGICRDIDECTLSNACLPVAVCTNATPTATTPGYACGCPVGYTGDGVTACSDVDECAQNTNDCPNVATCGNTTGSFTCTCPAGYAIAGAAGNRSCVNRDECADGTSTCDPRVVCADTDGSFTCSACPSGYTGDSRDPLVGCRDIDECDPLNPLHNCTAPASCINTNGNFLCGACPIGTEAQGNTCVDIDECFRGTDECGNNAVCTNDTQPVKYTCACPPGYSGNPYDTTTGCVVAAVDTPTLASGYRHTCAVYPDQSIRCWGANNASVVSAPPAAVDFKAVTNGLDFSCAEHQSGMVSCWGDNWAGQAPPSRTGFYIQIAAGERNVCGILNDHTLSCWGRDDTGQSSPPPGEYRGLAAGASHVCALNSAARDAITCWGASGNGRTAAPQAQVGAAWTQVSLGAEHSCALDTQGDVSCWGANAFGQTDVPSTLDTIVQVSAGGYFTCALDIHQAVTCWGSHGNAGVAGDPVSDVPAGVPFAAISASNTHVCGINATDGSYECWGENQYMQASPPP